MPFIPGGASVFLKTAKSPEQIRDSAWKLGVKLKEEIADFATFTKRTLGTEVGAIGKINDLIDATDPGKLFGSRIADSV
jgi:hypothetical protein